MNPHAYFPVAVMALTALIAFWLAWFVWQRRAVPGSVYFSLLMVAVAAYALADGAELAAFTLLVVTDDWVGLLQDKTCVKETFEHDRPLGVLAVVKGERH